MVKPRTKKTNRGTIPLATFQEAATLVNEHHISIRRAAILFGINHTTLGRFIQKMKNNEGEPVAVGYNPHNRVFSKEQESQLAQYCIYSDQLYYALSTDELRKLVYQFAKLNDIKYPKNWDYHEEASEDWLAAFMKRNPALSICKPQVTSVNRKIKPAHEIRPLPKVPASSKTNGGGAKEESIVTDSSDKKIFEETINKRKSTKLNFDKQVQKKPRKVNKKMKNSKKRLNKPSKVNCEL